MVVVGVVPSSVLDEVVVLVADLTALLVLELASAVLSTVLSLAAVAVALSLLAPSVAIGALSGLASLFAVKREPLTLLTLVMSVLVLASCQGMVSWESWVSLTWRACRVAPEVVLVVVLLSAMVVAKEVLVILALLVVVVEDVLLAIIVMLVVAPVGDMLSPCSS